MYKPFLSFFEVDAGVAGVAAAGAAAKKHGQSNSPLLMIF